MKFPHTQQWPASCLVVLAAALAPVLAESSLAQTRGMVADIASHSVTVFDSDSDTVIGSVEIPFDYGVIGDCSIPAGQRHGFVTDARRRIWVIDLAIPALAAGQNPIPISNAGLDTSVSPDGKFLVVINGVEIDPLSVIDVASRQEVTTFPVSPSSNSVDVCSDGSVLVASKSPAGVRRLTIDGAGRLTDTGESLALFGEPRNVTCAPDAASGIVITGQGHLMQSFKLPGLARTDIRKLASTFGYGAIIDATRGRVYAHSLFGIEAYFYHLATARLSYRPSYSFVTYSRPTLYGVDQLALNSDATKLYLSQPHAVDVLDPDSGALITSIVAPAIQRPTGICLSDERFVGVNIDIGPGSSRNLIVPTSQRLVVVGLLGSSTFDVEAVDVTRLSFGPAGAAPAHADGGHIVDLDGDNRKDLLSHYRILETGIAFGDTEACLSGRLFDGTHFAECDSIQTSTPR